MKRDNADDLIDAIARSEVVSTDVFDTLLLRTGRSERTRILKGERLFSLLLAQRGYPIQPDLLVEVRLQAQRLAFRELAVRESPGEVRLDDIIARQLLVLGLPNSLIAERLEIELRIEKESLVANEGLAEILRKHRRVGMRIVAVSDTTLSSGAVRDLIQHHHGSDLIDLVYTSADMGLTKRDGDLFLAVAQAENVSTGRMLHIGDDFLADVQRPSAKGVAAYHLPRRTYHRYIRVASGAVTEAGRLARKRTLVARASTSPVDDADSFGRNVLGPIVSQYCMLVWLYAIGAHAADETVLLFCARGGIGIREAFERVLERLCLPLAMRRENLMISRLVAARAALLARSSSVIEELDREFRGSVAADVARALGARAYQLPEAWNGPFDAQEFITLVFGSSGAEVLADIRRQNALFARHFRQLIGGSERVILCDTGLYGSTQRLLAHGFPEIRLETIQFARSNYKGHSEEHFPKVAGLMVEQNFYSPLNVRSCVLRYWHLVESLFEPAVPSVRLFTENEPGRVEANCGDITFGAVDPAVNNHLLSGTLAYIEALPSNCGYLVLRDADMAWHRLKRAIVKPTVAELRCLELGGRSVDFGRSEVLPVYAPRRNMTVFRKLLSAKKQLWREGAIARDFPLMKHLFLPMFGSVLSLRGLLARQR